MKRIVVLSYGALCYASFLAVFAYLAGFVGDLVVPKTIDGPTGSLSGAAALLANVGLIALFALQHTVMARPSFKRVWTRVVPKPVERSTYVLFTNLAFAALFLFWQPMPAVVWSAEGAAARAALWASFATGWGLVFVATLQIDHFDLFGLKQVWRYFRGQPYEPPQFKTPWLYRRVRHPLYVGWLTAFWSIPTMTVGHLLFAILTTAQILVSIRFEERNLLEYFGDRYRRYRERTPMLLPRLQPAKAESLSPAHDA